MLLKLKNLRDSSIILVNNKNLFVSLTEEKIKKMLIKITYKLKKF